jgi:hypothetical protein
MLLPVCCFARRYDETINYWSSLDERTVSSAKINAGFLSQTFNYENYYIFDSELPILTCKQWQRSGPILSFN